MNNCGLDVSLKSIAICIMNERGQIIKEKTCDMSQESLRANLKGFKKLKCVVESSALAETICVWVEELGYKINILDARQAKVVTASKKKTDKLDARKLARLCHTGWYTTVHRKSGEARNMRSYLTARMQIVKAATSTAATIRGLLRAHGIIVPLGEGAKFKTNVRKAIEGVDELLFRAIDPLLTLWEQLEAEEKRMYKALGKLVSKNVEVKRLLSVPGVGPATAAAFVATIDDPKRFASGEQVASYLGLVPSVYQSGEVEVRGRITKHGDELLRWLLVEASCTLLNRTKKECALKTWGLKLREIKGFGKAKVAVARKIACLLHHLWITKQSFNAKAA